MITIQEKIQGILKKNIIIIIIMSLTYHRIIASFTVLPYMDIDA